MWGWMDYCGEEEFSNTSLRFLFSAIKKSQLQTFHQKNRQKQSGAVLQNDSFPRFKPEFCTFGGSLARKSPVALPVALNMKSWANFRAFNGSQVKTRQRHLVGRDETDASGLRGRFGRKNGRNFGILFVFFCMAFWDVLVGS